LAKSADAADGLVVGDELSPDAARLEEPLLWGGSVPSRPEQPQRATTATKHNTTPLGPMI
jgi:hypothetical protein